MALVLQLNIDFRYLNVGAVKTKKLSICKKYSHLPARYSSHGNGAIRPGQTQITSSCRLVMYL